jgi:hypothetical protein
MAVAPAPQVRKPVFLVGCGRSGTTPLFDILSQHPTLQRTEGYPDGEDHDGWAPTGAPPSRSVIDRNGLTGRFALSLDTGRISCLPPGVEPPPGAPPLPGPGAPSLFAVGKTNRE